MGAVSPEVIFMMAPVNASCFVSAVEELQVRFLGILPASSNTPRYPSVTSLAAKSALT